MARNGSGAYSVSVTHVSGSTITAAALNSNATDAGSEITNSLALDGQSVMTGQLKAANGTLGAPSYTFGTDLDSGFYHISSDSIGLALGGSLVVTYSTTGAAITGTLSTSGALTVTAGGLTVIAGGLTVTAGNITLTAGDFAVNTNKFTIANATGNTAIAGTLGVTGDFAVNTNKFTVTASNGNTAVAGTLAVTGNATLTADISAATASGAMIATQSNQETGTSTTTLVTPGRQKFHPSASKANVNFDSAGNASASFGVSSITDTGTGRATINLSTAMSSATYVILATVTQSSGGQGNCRFAGRNGSVTPTTTAYEILTAQGGDGSLSDIGVGSTAIFGTSS